MFFYEDGISGDGGGRMWRPDIVPHAMRWLNSIPAASMKYLVRLRVSDIGGFIAVFRMGSSPDVHFEFDDSECLQIRVPEREIFTLCDRIVPFKQDHLEAMVVP
jgi:hypothetical protein